MSASPVEQTGEATRQRLRDRARQLGLPTWRCAPDGSIETSPQDRGLAGLWLRSGMLDRLITRAAAQWGQHEPTAPVRLFEGAWLLALAERQGGRITGYDVALALAPEALRSEHMVSSCSAAQLDVPATRHALEPLARHAWASIADLSRALRWMASDLDEVAEGKRAITDFTDALEFSYETIDLLYALGRSMSRPERPDVFVRRAMSSLHGVLDFCWVGATFVDDERVLPGVSGASLIEHDARLHFDALDRVLRRLLRECDDPESGRIIDEVPGVGAVGGPQVFAMPIARAGRVIGMIAAGDKEGDDPQISTFDTGLVEAAAAQIAPFLETTALYAEQHAMFMGTLSALTSAIDAKDRYTCGHSSRVAYLAAALAQKIGLHGDIVERVHIAGLVHDVGKIGVPEAVLGKPGRLTDPEFALIMEHPAIGHRILQGIPALRDVLPGVMYHHERWDGKGYPEGLSGEAIPLFARLIGIADTFDAMSSSRAYRPAMERTRVLEEIRRCSGAQFDPSLVPPFLALNFDEYDRMIASAAPQAAVAA